MAYFGFREFLPRCTVLLHGPAGSGKMTVVRAASCRLHLHLLKVGFALVFMSLCAQQLQLSCCVLGGLCDAMR